MFSHKKLLALAIFACFILQNAKAQITFSAHANTALPLFDWRFAFKPAIGGGARFGYHFTDVFALKISGDYILFKGQETRFLQKSKIPIHVNGEFHFKIGRFKPFTGIGAGITLERNIASIFRSKSTYFSANVIGGISYAISERAFIQLSSRFYWDIDSPLQTFSLGGGITL